MRKILCAIIGLLFTIPSWGALPSDYTKLEYIESTGTQYIKLPPFPNASNINVTADVLQTNGTSEQIFFAIDSVQTLYTSGDNWRVWRSNFGSTLLTNTSSRHSFDIKTTRSGVKYYIDGVQNTHVSETFYNSELFSARILFLGARTATTGADYFWQGRIYSFNSECDGVVCMNLVPAKRNSDNVVGMYDTVGERFYENAGSGSFIAGPIAEIKVATTKYVETQFGGLSASLAAAVATVNTVVTQTIAQAASIATLQSGKQTRPANDTCPAGKKCLLVEGTDGKPHWYEIITSRLPDGYTELQYIESTGTQYIDTGIVGKSIVGIEYEFTILNDITVGSSLFGTRLYGDIGSGINFGHSADGKITVDFFDGYRYTSNLSFEKNTPYRLVVQNNRYTLYNAITGATLDGHTFNATTSNLEYVAVLFGLNNGGSISAAKDSVKVTSCKIYTTNGTVNLVPALNPDGKIGMYDTVSGTFFENEGTGEFIGGQPVFN